MNTLQLYDTTLRDGTQGEGVSFTVEQKLKITQRLDAFGVEFIEGGYPASNPKDAEYFRRVKELRLHRARVTAFGMTRRKGVPAHQDATLQSIVASGASVATLVGKTWTLHVTEALQTTLDENLRMIEESVAYLRSQGLEVIYDAEHFFDGCRADAAYALRTLEAAVKGGASVLTLCDTNGGRLPREIAEMTRLVVERFPNVRIGIHTHNDSGLAVANTLAAVEAGATLVQGTVNGYGERCGNADLVQLIPILQLKMGYSLVPPSTLAGLSDLSAYVRESANLPPDPRQPFVGRSAFAHKGGMHVSALLRRPDTYEHIDPALVGNRRRVLVSELSGASNLLFKAREYGVELEPGSKLLRDLLDAIKAMENEGYLFDEAEASFELLLRKATGSVAPFFTPVSFEWLSEAHDGTANGTSLQARAEVAVDGERLQGTAAGRDPVMTLGEAIRSALVGAYPAAADIRITGYKSVELGQGPGSGGLVRVTLHGAAEGRSWSTAGVARDVAGAGWKALADAFEYGLMVCGAPNRRRSQALS